MLICDSCGEVFDDLDIRWERDETGEWKAWCPHCNWGIPDEAVECKGCGEWHCKDDLIDGWCEECLEEKLTFDTFLEFATDGFRDDECSLLEEFMFVKVYGWANMDVPNVSTPLFREVIENDYNERKNSVFNDSFMDLIQDYMKFYMSEFAEYLSEKEAKECTKQKTDGEQ